jgi:hypothetical protein
MMQSPENVRNELAPYLEQERLHDAQERQLAEEAREANPEWQQGRGRRLLVRSALVILGLAAVAALIVYYLMNR